ncbi:Major intrinsic protein [Macleaya cordata]|uniref:Major intrinsic protein n=1 Tax=Macleaya cordata TaxID=56857 RepID=A0A200Q4Y3_MACCD|nr:Major intrinsic protein [Macleaya cordata]
MGQTNRISNLINGEATIDEENPTKKYCGFIRGRDLNPARMVIAEMVGTFMLVYCVCGIIAISEMMGGGGGVGLLEYAVTGGLSIIVVIFSIGPISGAHVNPSITFAFAILGQFPWSRVPFYIVAQIVGSIFATYVGKSVYGIQADQVITKPVLHGRKKAFWAELIATFIIMFLAASMSRKAHRVGHISGVVVGVAISLAVLITGPVSGGSLNPARSMGPAIVSGKFDDLWVYVLAPTVGAAAGALLFRGLCIRCHHPRCSPNTSVPNEGGLFAN